MLEFYVSSLKKKILCLFISETERDGALVGEGQRERETQNPKQAPGSELSAQTHVLEPTNREITT